MRWGRIGGVVLGWRLVLVVVIVGLLFVLVCGVIVTPAVLAWKVCGEVCGEVLVSVSNGPIEFLGERAADAAGDTEFGGHGGLIQPLVDPRGGVGHELESFEASSVLARAGLVGLDPVEQTSGVLGADNPMSGGDVVDPYTGRTVDASMNQDVSVDGGKFSDLKP